MSNPTVIILGLTLSQSFFNRQQMVVGQGQAVGQDFAQSADPTPAAQPAAECYAASVRTQPLVGKADGD